ncbi:hypothetical protein SDC9_67297 [bioreactor metagenome]|uniref:Uncharacterized protein n=1 Tax=bioreactor metagenome TaxID=1076179 RepID=A0A644XXP2_9ZZZZ
MHDQVDAHGQGILIERSRPCVVYNGGDAMRLCELCKGRQVLHSQIQGSRALQVQYLGVRLYSSLHLFDIRRVHERRGDPEALEVDVADVLRPGVGIG